MSVSSRVARTASISMVTCSYPFHRDGDHRGIDHFARFDRFARLTYAGKLVNAHVGNHFNYPVTDIGLFLLRICSLSRLKEKTTR